MPELRSVDELVELFERETQVRLEPWQLAILRGLGQGTRIQWASRLMPSGQTASERMTAMLKAAGLPPMKAEGRDNG